MAGRINDCRISNQPRAEPILIGCITAVIKVKLFVNSTKFGRLSLARRELVGRAHEHPRHGGAQFTYQGNAGTHF